MNSERPPHDTMINLVTEFIVDQALAERPIQRERQLTPEQRAAERFMFAHIRLTPTEFQKLEATQQRIADARAEAR